MKISDYIAELESYRKRYGDLEVVTTERFNFCYLTLYDEGKANNFLANEYVRGFETARGDR